MFLTKLDVHMRGFARTMAIASTVDLDFKVNAKRFTGYRAT